MRLFLASDGALFDVAEACERPVIGFLWIVLPMQHPSRNTPNNA